MGCPDVEVEMTNWESKCQFEVAVTPGSPVVDCVIRCLLGGGGCHSCVSEPSSEVI